MKLLLLDLVIIQLTSLHSCCLLTQLSRFASVCEIFILFTRSGFESDSCFLEMRSVVFHSEQDHDD